MQLTAEQIAEMAPDPASAAAGKKLAGLKHWQSVGKNTAALWGLCQGSAVYQVKVDLANMGYHCSCPSRMFPCKHVLGLLLLVSTGINTLTVAVVTGTLASGEINEGAEMQMFPGGGKVRVRGLQAHSRTADVVTAGQRVAVNLGGIDHSRMGIDIAPYRPRE